MRRRSLQSRALGRISGCRTAEPDAERTSSCRLPEADRPSLRGLSRPALLACSASFGLEFPAPLVIAKGQNFATRQSLFVKRMWRVSEKETDSCNHYRPIWTARGLPLLPPLMAGVLIFSFCAFLSLGHQSFWRPSVGDAFSRRVHGSRS